MNRFKVGDFVTYIHDQNNRTLQIENINCERYYFKNTSLVLAEYEIKYWEPKQGEWVWCKGSIVEAFIFQWTSKHLFEINKYEPFIGQLPLFLKD